MLELTTPRGHRVNVPESRAEDPSPRFAPGDGAGIRAYYDANGYVVVEGLIDPADCDEVRDLWAREIKSSGHFLYRQSARPERHLTNPQGWIMNPVLNLQSVDPRRFPGFRRFATERILAAPQLRDGFRALLDDTPKIVQSMFFEGNSATEEHQDTYYLDSERLGKMAAAWVALEDIAPRAGRFFVCPGSHRLDMGVQRPDNNIADHHDVYIGEVATAIATQNYEIRAPALRKGDVLFWNARTMHGSLDSRDPDHSRASITCHAIPARDRFMKLQIRAVDLKTDTVNEVLVHRPKDQARFANRVVLWAGTRFPGPLRWMKKRAISMLVRRRRPAPSA